MFDRFLDFFFGKLLWVFTEGAQLSLLDAKGCYYRRSGGGRFTKDCLGSSLSEIAAIDHPFPLLNILLSISYWLVMIFLWAMILGLLIYAVISFVMWLTNKDWREGIKKGGKVGPLKAAGSAFILSIVYSVPVMLWFFLPLANPIIFNASMMRAQKYNPMFYDWVSWKVAVFSPKLYVYLEMFALKISAIWWLTTAGQPLPTIARSSLGF